MADTIKFSLIGLADLEEKLKVVADDVKNRGGRFALRKAAQVVHAKAVANAKALDDPETAKDTSKNMAIRWSGKHFRRTGELGFRVGVLGGARKYTDNKENRRKGRAGGTYKTDGDKGNPGGDTWAWRMVEFGTERTQAQPFMRPALEASIGEATDTFVREYDKALGRAIKRAAKKAGKL